VEGHRTNFRKRGGNSENREECDLTELSLAVRKGARRGISGGEHRGQRGIIMLSEKYKSGTLRTIHQRNVYSRKKTKKYDEG